MTLKLKNFKTNQSNAPNQKNSWEDSVIMMGKPAMSHQIFVGQPYLLSWAHGWHMSRLLRETSNNAAHNI